MTSESDTLSDRLTDSDSSDRNHSDWYSGDYDNIYIVSYDSDGDSCYNCC